MVDVSAKLTENGILADGVPSDHTLAEYAELHSPAVLVTDDAVVFRDHAGRELHEWGKALDMDSSELARIMVELESEHHYDDDRAMHVAWNATQPIVFDARTFTGQGIEVRERWHEPGEQSSDRERSQAGERDRGRRRRRSMKVRGEDYERFQRFAGDESVPTAFAALLDEAGVPAALRCSECGREVEAHARDDDGNVWCFECAGLRQRNRERGER